MPRTSATPAEGAVSRRSSAVPRFPLAPVTATVLPARFPGVSSAMSFRYPRVRAATRIAGLAPGPTGVGVILGAHVILYSTDAEADRALLRDLLGLPHVDAGGGWLIQQLPPAEVAVHPAETSGAA